MYSCSSYVRVTCIFLVFGHDSRQGLQNRPFTVGIDTGCVYGKELTAKIFPGEGTVSVRASRKHFE